MAKLVALDLELKPRLFDAITELVESRTAFCVLDQRVSTELKRQQALQMGATHLHGPAGEQVLIGGTPVEEDIGLVMLTSGSSGEPKAAELSWDALLASARISSQRLAIESDSVWVPALPANHIGGLAVLMRAVFGFAHLQWTSDLATAPEEGATHIAIVQAQVARADFSGYRHVLVGGAKAPSNQAPNMIATWGMTETGSGIVYDGHMLSEVEVAEINGELLVRSPTLFSRYRNAERPSASGPDGRADWFPTGDGGSVSDGRVQVFGRMGSVITTGGEKVWPEQLEQALRTHPGVAEIAITSVEDLEWGEAVVAVVVSDGPLTLDELGASAQSQIGPWAKPKFLLKVEEIPRTSNGKIRRSTLATLAQQMLNP